jgi:hypothetical protein
MSEIKPCKITEHIWKSERKPEGNRSGYHVDICEVCGEVHAYDDSD